MMGCYNTCSSNYCYVWSLGRSHATVQIVFYLFDQMGKTALHDAASKGNAEMVAYMMEQVNPNVDARDVVSRSHSNTYCPIQCIHLHNE